MRFKLNADMEFEADDIKAALTALEDYFACAVAGEEHELEYIGEIKIDPVVPFTVEIGPPMQDLGSLPSEKNSN